MKKMWRKVLAAAMVLTMILSLAACGSKGDDKSDDKKSSEKSSDVKIGFVVSDMSDAFFAHLVQKMQDDADSKGVTLTVKAVSYTHLNCILRAGLGWII